MQPSRISDTKPSDPDDAVFLRMRAVVRMTGLGRSTIYRLVAQRKFPAQVRLATRAVAWKRSDLLRWKEAREAVAH